MRNTRSSFHMIALALFSLLVFGAGRAVAKDADTLFYNVTTDDVWRAGMAIGQANSALKSGYKVVIFLNVRGVYIASKKRRQDTFAAAGKSPQALLKSAMKHGARVVICPMCMQQAGLAMDDVIEGIEKGGPGVTFKLMAAEGTRIVSY